MSGKSESATQVDNIPQSPAPRVEWHEKPEFPISIHHNRGIGTDHGNGAEVLGIHCHDDFEILHVAQGSATFRIGADSCRATEGDILFVNPYEFHSATVEPGEEVLYDAIVYERQLLESITLHPDYNRFIRPLLDQRIRIPHQLPPDSRIAGQVRQLVRDILEEFKEKPVGHEWMIRTSLERLAVLLYRHAPDAVPDGLSAAQRLGRDLAPLFARIAENPAIRLSTRDAARIARLSPYHFCRMFKAYAGRTFIDFLNLYRVNEAERLLRDTERTVTEIAEQVGFCNIHYFDRVYRAYKGHTPGQLRRR